MYVGADEYEFQNFRKNIICEELLSLCENLYLSYTYINLKFQFKEYICPALLIDIAIFFK